MGMLLHRHVIDKNKVTKAEAVKPKEKVTKTKKSK